MSTLSFACSLLNQVPLAQVQHVVVAEALLHLVEFVGADRVEVKALKLLLEDLGNGEVVEVVHGALEVVHHELRVAVVAQFILTLLWWRRLLRHNQIIIN